MNRHVPVQLLRILEHWFKLCHTSVRWNGQHSVFYKLNCGVRQGGVLSPYLFAIYIDDVIKKVIQCSVGCHFQQFCASIFLYADDILLLAPSVHYLQKLLYVVETELTWLDMAINPTKSCCLRFGPRYDKVCENICDSKGNYICWNDSCGYLGIYLKSFRNFKCTFENNKKAI